MAPVNNTIRQVWFYMDTAEAPLTGMVSPTDVALTLKVDAGVGTVTAPEVVGWVERGAGFYDVEFTPGSPGLYTLFLKELNAGSFQRRYSFVYEVQSAGAAYAPAFASAFCAETDVERWTQLTFDGTSKPTSTEVAGFAQARASEMRSILAAGGWAISPAAVVSGSIEQDSLREANAIGAAADTLLAKFMDTEPAKTEKAASLLGEYDTRMKRLLDYAKKVLGTLQIRTPMTSGELTLRSETPIEDAGLSTGIRMDQEW